MTDVYMAYNHSANPLLAGWEWEERPVNLLVALPYLKMYESAAAKHDYRPANLMLDSGAFSAWKSGHEVDIDDLVSRSKDLRWSATVGLDVIGDAQGSRENLDYMKAQGSPAMPVFHLGDPWELLDHYCAGWDKVGLSCRFGEPIKESLKFYEQCFARTYPHKFHSFGWLSEDALTRFPFWSADSSTWTMPPQVFRSNVCIRGTKVGVRAKGPANQTMIMNLGGSIQHYRDFQARLKTRWSAEMARLEKL